MLPTFASFSAGVIASSVLDEALDELASVDEADAEAAPEADEEGVA